ncbi:MAG: KH domain-containing protein [Candidatus Moraniibacteriota bacterium]|nr:MAG: KH domain-containing protein [Candidatus Moranbacteria bacterium]
MTEEKYTDKEFVEFISKLLVDHPDDVKVERRIDEMGVLITLDVNAQDMGMIIGRDGATAKALRTLLRVIGARHNARVNLKINEPEGSTREKREDKREDRRDDKREDKREERRREFPKEEEKRSLDDVVNDIQI